jgi:ABC-2 type transport system ATP-binding protein
MGSHLSEGQPLMHLAVQSRGLTKVYGAVRAVDGIDLAVPAGGIYGFLGPNGAGKTTTIRMLLGLVRPTSGSMQVRAGGVGALIEGPAFYPFLSGRDNLRSVCARARVPRGRVEEVLGVVGLSDRAADRFSSYSLGMKQRLGVAAALVRRPQLLVLDAPTNGLDPSGITAMRSTLRDLAEGGCTVLLSSHLLAEVQQVCDTVGVIHRGRLLSQGPIEELGGAGSLRVVADPLDLAQDKARRLLGAGSVESDGDGLRLRVERSMTASITRALVAEGIAVHEMRWQEPNLERVFFDLTGETPEGQESDDVA